MSHTALTYHIIFGTYRRMSVIPIPHEKELYKYILHLSHEKDVIVRRIGGMPDHIHILCDIPAKLSVAEYVKVLKSETSKFLRINPHFPHWTKWSEGYAAFTVDSSSRETRRQYIINQKEHHSKIGFFDEFRSLLQEAGLNPQDTFTDEE